MSFPWIPPLYDHNGRALNWLNGIYSHHDSWCGCNNIPLHFFLAIFKSDAHKPTQEETKELQQCLGIIKETTVGAPDDTNGEKEDILEGGELETLFAQSDDIEDGTG